MHSIVYTIHMIHMVYIWFIKSFRVTDECPGEVLSSRDCKSSSKCARAVRVWQQYRRVRVGKRVRSRVKALSGTKPCHCAFSS
jgi:hypothetical protein